MKTDDSIRQICVDGHTDDAGMPRDNIALSKRRAAGVTRYLIANGCPADKLVTRYHGEKYPVTSNSNPKTKARNRRTTIRLSRALPSIDKTPEPVKTAEI